MFKSNDGSVVVVVVVVDDDADADALLTVVKLPMSV